MGLFQALVYPTASNISKKKNRAQLTVICINLHVILKR